MKRKLLFLMTAATAFAACSQIEEDSVIDMESYSDGNSVKKVVFTVPELLVEDEIADTRSTLIPTDSAFDFAWEQADVVGIYPDTGSQIYWTIEGDAGTNTCEFTGGGWALKSNSTYSSYYPFVPDYYLSTTEIPVSFADQKQTGYNSTSFDGFRFFLSAPASVSNGSGGLTFVYDYRNIVIKLKATLPAGTYTKASICVEDSPVFVKTGTYDIAGTGIDGTTYSNTLDIDLEDFTLTESATVPIYLSAAPVDLREHPFTVRVYCDNGLVYKCEKSTSKLFVAGTIYGFNCPLELEGSSIIQFQDSNVEAICVQYWDSNSDGKLSVAEARAVQTLGDKFAGNTDIEYFDELQYFTGLTKIGDYTTSSASSPTYNTFNGCNKLKSVTLPETVTHIYRYAFAYCHQLANVDIKGDITYVGTSAFHNDPITSIDLGSVTIIGDDAFYGTALTSVDFSESLTTIGEGAFQYSDLTGIVIPSSVTSIGENAFSWCPITSAVINAALTSIPEDLFYHDKLLESFQIPSTVTEIGGGAFGSCEALTEIEIPEGVTTIGDYAFLGCTGLTSIVIPENVTSIGLRAFGVCSSLARIDVLPETPPTNNQGFYSTGDCPIFVPSGSYSNYVNSWSDYADRIVSPNRVIYYTTNDGNTITPNSTADFGANITQNLVDENGKGYMIFDGDVTTIGVQAFQGFTNLTQITIPEGVTSIGLGAFDQCNQLVEVTIPDSVTSIGKDAFKSNINLASITLPANLQTIGETAFMFCNGLQNVIIPEGVTSIGHYAFSCCHGITSVSLPSTLTSLSNYAFENCTSLASITIPSGVTSLYAGMFSGCTSLTDVTLPNTLTEIQLNAFQNCTHLYGITIPASVQTIGANAFYCCSQLASVQFENSSSLTEIGDTAFAWSGLESFNSPESLETIGKDAFNHCLNLLTVQLTENVYSIGETAFANCESLSCILVERDIAAPEGSDGMFDNTNDCPIYVPFDSVDKYLNTSTTAWTPYASRIRVQNETRAIYYSCASGYMVTPHSSISDHSAVFGAGYIDSYVSSTGYGIMTFDGPVTSIGQNAFKQSSVVSMVIPAGVTIIGNDAFTGCTNLTNINVPEGVTEIRKAFSGCSNLPEITLPSTLTSLYGLAFSDCTSLTSVKIWATIPPVQDQGFFNNCDNLTGIYVPSGSVNAYKAAWNDEHDGMYADIIFAISE